MKITAAPLLVRLRDWHTFCPSGDGIEAMLHEAADEIERLQALLDNAVVNQQLTTRAHELDAKTADSLRAVAERDDLQDR